MQATGTSAPRGAAPYVIGRLSGLSVFSALLALAYWQIAVVLRSVVPAVELRACLVSAVVWTVLAVVTTALRGRLATWGSAAFAATAVLTLTVNGTLGGRTDLAWWSITCLTMVPLAMITVLRARGVALTAAGCALGACVLVFQGPGPVRVQVLEASGVVAALAAPALLLVALLGHLEELEDRAHRAAVTDELTGMLNRRGLREQVDDLVVRAGRAGHVVAVVMADLDHFKAVNDAFGHDGGDRVLQAVAGQLRAVARAQDLLVRMGGEELAWIAAFAGAQEAREAAERARVAVASAAPDLSGTVAGAAGLAAPRTTASIGVATSSVMDAQRPGALELLAQLVRDADAALYAAKAAGRDRVVHAQDLAAELRDPSRRPQEDPAAWEPDGKALEHHSRYSV